MKGQISELKKLVEKTFLELDDFAKMDETLLKMIKDSTQDTQTFYNGCEMSYHEKTLTENYNSFQTQ